MGCAALPFLKCLSECGGKGNRNYAQQVNKTLMITWWRCKNNQQSQTPFFEVD
jgi:hypothetical protein